MVWRILLGGGLFTLMLGCGLPAPDECESAPAEEAPVETAWSPPAPGLLSGGPTISGLCLQWELQPDASGQVPCRLFDYRRPVDGQCACDTPGLSTPGEVPRAVHSELRASGFCLEDSCCRDWCVCELGQLSGDELEACQEQRTPDPELHGFCYVDPAAGYGSEELVGPCYPYSRRLRVLPLRGGGDSVVICSSQVE